MNEFPRGRRPPFASVIRRRRFRVDVPLNQEFAAQVCIKRIVPCFEVKLAPVVFDGASAIFAVVGIGLLAGVDAGGGGVGPEGGDAQPEKNAGGQRGAKCPAGEETNGTHRAEVCAGASGEVQKKADGNVGWSEALL